MREFSRSLPMLLMRAREHVMAEFRPFLVEHALTEQQWRVLRALAATDAPLSVGELADRTLLLGPSLSRILVNLDDRGLIERSPAREDARRSDITISSPGLALVAQVAPLGEARYLAIERRFGHDRLEQLYMLLSELAESAGEPAYDEQSEDHDRTNDARGEHLR